MTQNIYDQSDFFGGYSKLPRSQRGLAAAPEWPSLRAMLPPMTGLRVVDLGCGFGWFCRFAREHGARSVLGVDVSENMLARAGALTADAAITYWRADLETLDLPEASFNLAYSSLALHYVANLDRLLATVSRALVPGSHFVFSIEHPIFMASRHPGWRTDAHGRTWPVDSYFDEGPRTTTWFVDGVVKQHRTMGTTLGLLLRHGFAIAHVEEWRPTPAQIAAGPELAAELERPMFLLIGARR